MRIKTLLWAALAFAVLAPVAPLAPAHAGVVIGTDSYIITEGTFVGEQLFTLAGALDVTADLNGVTGAVGTITLADPNVPGSRDTFTGNIRGQHLTGVPVLRFTDAPAPVADMADAVMLNLAAFNSVNRSSPRFGDANTFLQNGISAQLFAAQAILADPTLDPSVVSNLIALLTKSTNLDAVAVARVQARNKLNSIREIKTAQQAKRQAMLAIIAATVLVPTPGG
jgi:hypothetical protein